MEPLVDERKKKGAIIKVFHDSFIKEKGEKGKFTF